MKTPKNQPLFCEIFILAGGLSTRMGRDKSRVRLGQRTLLQHVRAAASQLGYPVRTLCGDAVARSGPIGGIYTALKRSRAEAVMFLACDMPFISSDFLRKLIETFEKAPYKQFDCNGLHRTGKSFSRNDQDLDLAKAVFTFENGLAGFPCILSGRGAFQTLAGQIARGNLSLQNLAKSLGAKLVRPPVKFRGQLMNINTPADLEKAMQAERDGTNGK